MLVASGWLGSGLAVVCLRELSSSRTTQNKAQINEKTLVDFEATD